ncbi:uncharacterized protein HD556DRAFT_1445755 [Suillus plorans]|uniref:Uncharacterized protein n=1 Tax=Suillus plorans TaxID=116603 RepID=A0A9P7AJW2_9AGAM|nr:uncharacterized protein HD556DRAFT_1445755 [Suillus plorans]KAG1790989.1 hypothetical protein HD556DRAFT_1445755 [Suillus plorans]
MSLLVSPDCWSSATLPLDDYCWSDLFPWNTFDKHNAYFPPSPSETCSSFSTDLSPSPEPVTLRVVCDVPLLAPRPLPYHSPTFLKFDLPDPDQDLSHPPYTHRPSKRKRDLNDDHHRDHLRVKRRNADLQRWAAGVYHTDTQGRSHVYTATRPDRPS